MLTCFLCWHLQIKIHHRGEAALVSFHVLVPDLQIVKCKSSERLNMGMLNVVYEAELKVLLIAEGCRRATASFKAARTSAGAPKKATSVGPTSASACSVKQAVRGADYRGGRR